MHKLTHWTQVLSDVSLVEFVLLAALTTLQWVRHRIRGAGWVALSFAILGGLSLVVKIDPSLAAHQYVAKSLIALLLVVPYCLFRFAATFRPPSRTVRSLAAGVTAGIIAFTFTLAYLPAPGIAATAPLPRLPRRLRGRLRLPLHLCRRPAVRGREGRTADRRPSRMRLLAVAVAGLEVQVVVAALGWQGPTVKLVTQAVTVAMGILFLVALVLPSFMRVFLSRKEDLAFRRAIGELVSAGDSRDVAEHLLPHVCALVGASEAALLAGDGTVVARHPVWPDNERFAAWGVDRDRRRRAERVGSRCRPTAARRTRLP